MVLVGPSQPSASSGLEAAAFLLSRRTSGSLPVTWPDGQPSCIVLQSHHGRVVSPLSTQWMLSVPGTGEGLQCVSPAICKPDLERSQTSPFSPKRGRKKGSSRLIFRSPCVSSLLWWFAGSRQKDFPREQTFRSNFGSVASTSETNTMGTVLSFSPR